MYRSCRIASIVSLLLLLCVGSAWAASGYIRVNQLGYETGLSGRAYLMVEGMETSATFTVRDDDGKTVYSAPVGTTTGTWGTFTVYALDFTVACEGQYTISVKGTIPAPAVKFTVGSASDLYSGAIENALDFYQDERDGHDYIPSGLRNAPSHLNDTKLAAYQSPLFDANDGITAPLVATGKTIDAEGGWWDAGDYLKFVQTHSYTVGMLLTGVRDFPNQMGHGSPNADFTSEAKFGARWLSKMWDDKSKTLYYQVGIGTDFNNFAFVSDHDIWRLPELDDTYQGTDPNYQYIRHRPVFAAGPAGSKISPNLAGRLAASFALCYRVFKWEDPAFAQQCLLNAEHIFDLADTNPAVLITAAPEDFYPETEWRDDLEWGATELYLALSDTDCATPSGLPHSDANYYLKQATKWAKAYITGPNDAVDTLNLYDVAGLAHYDLYRAIDRAGHPSGLAVSQVDLLGDLAKQLATATTLANADPFRFGFTWNNWDSTTHGAGISITAKEYYSLTGEGHWADESRLWLGNIMGANAWGFSLIVGDGTNFPDCLQHQVANLRGSLDGHGILLRGAAVEGPNAVENLATGFVTGMNACPANGIDSYAIFDGNDAAFQDNVQNFPNTEPAIDLTASSPLMFAWRIAGQPDRRAIGF